MKKLNKFFAVLVALAMMATLCVSMAFAEGKPAENGKVYLTKTLTIAPGLAGPQEFSFTATPKTVDGNAYIASPANMPAITIDDTNGILGTTATDGNIIKNVEIDLTSVAWPHAGEYIYEITENVPADVDENNTKAGITYDVNKYNLRVLIKNGTSGPEVAGAEVTKPDGTKVDPTKPTDPTAGDEDDGINADGVNFENKYVKVADDTDVDPENPDPDTPDSPEDTDHASFVITKTVDPSNNGDLTKQFKFTLAIDESDTNAPAAALEYYKYDKDGKGTKLTSLNGLTLADGEKLAVYGAYVGTKYTVTEDLEGDDAAAARYTAAATVNNSGANEINANKVTTPIEQGKNVAVTNAVVVDEAQNVAAYTNTRAEDSTPTGILISNLPYIALALVAIGGLVAYVVVRRRQDNEA